VQKLKGRLLYMGWFNLPWKLVTEKGDVDLWPIINKFLTSLSGKQAWHEETLDGYTLSEDASSEFRFTYVPGKYVLLEKPGKGMSNVFAYLNTALCQLSGRQVQIEIEKGKQVKFTANPTEKVFGVYFTGDGNWCAVPRDSVESVCKPGQDDCCIFHVWGANGPQCGKFDSFFARQVLDRLAKGATGARRIGNCALLGRKGRETTPV